MPNSLPVLRSALGVAPGRGTATLLRALVVALVLGVALTGLQGDAPADSVQQPLADRVDTADPVEAAVRMTREGVGRNEALWVVLSRSDLFADSLAGAALAGPNPLLLTPPTALDPRVRQEIQRALGPGGTVYLLGGEQALAPGVADQLRADGFTVRRLYGPSRVETSVAVAREVWRLGGSGEPEVALARDDDWADSVTGGAWAAYSGTPVLVTSRSALHPAVRAALAELGVRRTVLLGGTAALSDAVAREVPAPRRVSGATRSETATAIADRLWDDYRSTRHVIVNGFAPNGWAFGFAAAPLAARLGAPVLLVDRTSAPQATLDRVGACANPLTSTRLIGDASVIAEEVRSHVVACAGRPLRTPCGALTVGEVSTAVTEWHRVEANVWWGSTDPRWRGSCAWTSSDGQRSVEIEAYAGASAFREMADDWTAERVEGIGDEAVRFVDPDPGANVDLWIRVGDATLRLRYAAPGADSSGGRGLAEDLTRAAVARWYG